MDFGWVKVRKTGEGVVYLPPEKNQNRNQFVFLSFGEDPLNWQNFIEIGEMLCSTTAWCSGGHTLKLCFEWGITLFLASDTSL